jgi:hypothetical protein
MFSLHLRLHSFYIGKCGKTFTPNIKLTGLLAHFRRIWKSGFDLAPAKRIPYRAALIAKGKRR